MRTSNQSLAGFLKKKTLFGQSPLKNLTVRDSPVKNKIVNNKQINQKNLNSSSSSKYLNSFNEDQDYDDRKQYVTNNSGYPLKYSRFGNNRSHYQQHDYVPKTLQKNYSSKSPIKLNSSLEISKQEEQSQIWAGLVNYSSTFQSSRLQSVRCIQQMSQKLAAQFQIINHKIQNFHNQLVQAITRQLFQAKQKILQTVVKIFQESEVNLKQYIKREQEKVAHQLYRIKQLLQKEYQKVELMKEGINKSSWKKTAGQLISSELEKRVQILLRESQSIGKIKWQLTNVGKSKLSALQNQIRSIIKIQVNEIK